MSANRAATIARWLEASVEHSETWGMVWFGLLFWGSVINAAALRFLPDTDTWIVGWASYATGLAVGALARARGGWL